MAITILDPLAQSFIIDSASYPYGAFLSSIRLFFKTKPTTQIPIYLSVVTTQNSYPTSKTIDYSEVVLYPIDVKISNAPHYLDSTTYTDFVFSAPVYIKSDELYAFVIRSNSDGYNLWCAQQSDLPIASSVKTLPTDELPTLLSKIAKSPYIGTLFESQNGINYDADQTRDLMFVINRCSFNTVVSPKLQFIVPDGLSKSSSVEHRASKNYSANVVYDQYNLSVSQLKPEKTNIIYTAETMLNTTFSLESAKDVSPGDFATRALTDIHLNDNNGKRVLTLDGTRNSFYLNATLTTDDERVSPVISDDGTNIYPIKNIINNLPLSNSIITIAGGGTGYLSGASGLLSGNIIVSAPDQFDGVQATVQGYANSGVLTSVYVVNPGSGYSVNPTISITAANTAPANVFVYGETSVSGGNALVRYQTIPVTLAADNDSGDMRLFITAYRPSNTKIFAYYKIISRNDSLLLEESSWQQMTNIGQTTKYSTTRDDLIEFQLAPGTSGVAQNYVSYTNPKNGIVFNDFFRYAIKIVMASGDSTFSPFLKNIRVVVLPSGVI
jgi:hypothetical protein